MPRLSPFQIRALTAAAGERLHRSQSGKSYELVHDGPRRDVTDAVKVLAGTEPPLLELGERERFVTRWRLTGAGEAALECGRYGVATEREQAYLAGQRTIED